MWHCQPWQSQGLSMVLQTAECCPGYWWKPHSSPLSWGCWTPVDGVQLVSVTVVMTYGSKETGIWNTRLGQLRRGASGERGSAQRCRQLPFHFSLKSELPWQPQGPRKGHFPEQTNNFWQVNGRKGHLGLTTGKQSQKGARHWDSLAPCAAKVPSALQINSKETITPPTMVY